MSDGPELCHLSGWAWRWVTATISDETIKFSLAEENLVSKIPWGGRGYRVEFWLARAKIERTIEHLEDLETRRMSKNLPNPGGFHVDEWTFTNAADQLREVLETT